MRMRVGFDLGSGGHADGCRAAARRPGAPGDRAYSTGHPPERTSMPRTWDPDAVSPEEAVQRLVDGNRRFREGAATSVSRTWDGQRANEAQRPFAIVLGCSDSRTPVEILFDQGFGDLFVIRIAGNIVAPSGIGSIEFAASQFGTRLVVVMGHTRCGAVGATVKGLETGMGPESKNIRSITDRIAPHIEGLVKPGNTDGILREAVRANVRASVDQLRHGSRIIEDLVIAGRVTIVGAEYELETGAVHFLDGVPARGSAAGGATS
jgi:carbonic anhydrase